MSILVGAGGGSILGFLIGSAKAPSKIKTAREQFKSELKQQHDLVTAHKDRASDSNKKFQSAKKELSAAKKDLSRLEQQVRDLKKRPYQSAKKTNAHRSASAIGSNKSSNKQSNNKNAKRSNSNSSITNEAMQKLTAERDAALSAERDAKKAQQKTHNKLDDLEKQLSQLRSTAKKRTQQLETVQLELDVKDLKKAFEASKGSVDSILDILVKTQQLESAVLADVSGIVVAKSGSQDILDGMAASSRLVAAQSEKMSDLVPFSSLQTFHFVDDNQMVISGSEFTLKHGEALSLVTYGGHYPSENSIALTKEHLENVLG